MKRENASEESRLLVKRLAPPHDGIQAPQKAGDVGYDLVVLEDAVVYPGSAPIDIPRGFQMKIPDTHFALIVGRSSASRKHHLLVVPAIIDSGYTGPIYTPVYNVGKKSVLVTAGMRLAQCVFLPKQLMPIEFVEALPETERGSSGFGSTGE